MYILTNILQPKLAIVTMRESRVFNLSSSSSSSPRTSTETDGDLLNTGPVGSLACQQGHLYSLAVDGDLLYTGSDSKFIRIWKKNHNHPESSSGLKSRSGLVKAIVVSGSRIFTGHRDGKIRAWSSATHERVGTLPKLKEFLASRLDPWGGRTVRHADAVSCLSVDAEAGVLYSGSWDRTVKAWRVSDSRCLESIAAHSDAINSVAAGPGGLVLSGSADGTVKVWRREWVEGSGGSATRHVLERVLVEQEHAVTALAVSKAGGVYCGTSDGAVRFWEMIRGRGLVDGGVLRGHKLAVLCLATAGAGLAISGSADRTVRVWRREEGGAHACVSVLTAHSGPIKCLAVGDDVAAGCWLLYSGSLDETVRIWRVSDRSDRFGDVRLAQ